MFICHERPGIKIRVHSTDSDPVHYVLTRATNTTACMSLITWNRAYSLFPRHTLIDHKLFPLRDIGDEFGIEMSALTSLGWTNRDLVWADQAIPKGIKLEGLRRIGDAATLTIKLTTEQELVPQVPASVVEMAQFEVQLPSSDRKRPAFNRSNRNLDSWRPGPPGEYFKIKAETLSSPAVRHVYITASRSWRDYLKERLKRWSWLELYKISSDVRPEPRHEENFVRQVRPMISDFILSPGPPPESWDYADDQVAPWFSEWERDENDG